jgi:hypothetical protein
MLSGFVTPIEHRCVTPLYFLFSIHLEKLGAPFKVHVKIASVQQPVLLTIDGELVAKKS